MQIIEVTLDQLKISKFNMRVNEKKPDLSHILPTVRSKGILVPPIIRAEDGIYGVVAGRSRWFCAREIEAEGGSVGPIKCCLMDEGEDADALEASMIENFGRRDPHPVSLHEHFVHLIKMKRTIEGIGLTFGKTPAQVRQCLALGRLAPKVRNLYREGEIDDGTAAALTLGSITQQREWLKLWDDNNAPMGEGVRDWLLGGEQIATSAALFALDLYKGETVGDLFAPIEDDGSSVTFFRDLDQFWQLQNTAIAEQAERLKADGWDDVHVLEVGDAFHPYGHVKTGKDKGGHVYISVAHNGVVEIHKGWLTRKEVEAIEKAAEKAKKKASNDNKPDGTMPAPSLSSTFENYLNLHRHAIVRADLLDHPRTAFRLLIAHAYASSGNWRIKADPQTARSDIVAASLAQSPAQAALAAQKEAVEALMKLGKHPTTEKAFARLLELSDPQVMLVGVVTMADTLEAGSAMVDALGEHLNTDARRFWQPDEAFFELARDRATVNGLLAEIGGKALAKANVTEKGKTQKGIIRDFLAGTNGRAKVEGWLPGWFEYPFRALGAKSRKPKEQPAPEAIAAE